MSVSREEARRIIEEARRIKDVLYAGRPALLVVSHVLGYLIPDSTEVSRTATNTAAVGPKALYINPDFWSSLTATQREFVLAHEGLHYALSHPEFQKRCSQPLLANIAADCVINEELLRHFDRSALGEKFYRDMVNAETLHEFLLRLAPLCNIPESKVPSEDWFRRATLEEIYSYLVWFSSRCPRFIVEGRGRWRHLPPDDVKPGDMPGGRRNLGADLSKPGDIVERLVRRLRPAIDWREKLRDLIGAVAMGEPISTWKKPSRRHPDYPGYYFYGAPRITLLIDVSGSITSKVLSRFMTEVRSLCEEVNIDHLNVIYWSTEVVRVMERVPPSEVETVVEVAERLPAGGTNPAPALEKSLEYADIDAGIILLTDGIFSDAARDEVYSKASLAANSYGRALYVFTESRADDYIPSDLWDKVMIPPDEG